MFLDAFTRTAFALATVILQSSTCGWIGWDWNDACSREDCMRTLSKAVVCKVSKLNRVIRKHLICRFGFSFFFLRFFWNRILHVKIALIKHMQSNGTIFCAASIVSSVWIDCHCVKFNKKCSKSKRKYK